MATTKEWMSDHPSVLVMTYELFGRILTNKKLNSDSDVELKNRLIFETDLLICDEGHAIRNVKSNIHQAANEIRTNKRIVLTGTPIQNNLAECEFSLVLV